MLIIIPTIRLHLYHC